jgi:hypothetical protein
VPWKRLVLLLLLILGAYRWYEGKLDRFLPDAARSRTVLGSWGPDEVHLPPAPPAVPAPAPAPPK